MKKHLLKLTPLLLGMALSCGTSTADTSLDKIVEIYGGKFSIVNGVSVSIDEGKESYIRLVSENNKLVADGWLLPEAMANNCAILFSSLNPNIVNEKDIIEVEISNGRQNSFKYGKNELDDLDKEYHNVEEMLIAFIDDLRANEINKAKNLIESTSNHSDNDLTSFLKAFKSTIPAKYKETKLIGYRKEKTPEQLFIVDCVLIAKDETQKLVNATLVSINDDFKFREINF